MIGVHARRRNDAYVIPWRARFGALRACVSRLRVTATEAKQSISEGSRRGLLRRSGPGKGAAGERPGLAWFGKIWVWFGFPGPASRLRLALERLPLLRRPVEQPGDARPAAVQKLAAAVDDDVVAGDVAGQVRHQI